MPSIVNPYIRDTITVDAAFNRHLSTFAGGGSLHVLARRVDLHADFAVGAHPVVIVCDEFRGNGHLIDARGKDSASPGAPGVDARPPAPAQAGEPGGHGGHGGPGNPGGTVTLMCRRSSGVRIDCSGGTGAAGGAGGKGGPGADRLVTPGGTVTTTKFDENGNPFEVEEQLDDLEVPGTPGALGGFGGDGGAGGAGGTIRFTSIVDDSPPELRATGGKPGTGGPGGAPGAHGHGAELPRDFDNTPVPGSTPGPAAEGSISVTTLSEQDYVAGLRPLLDAEASFANHWAPYRVAVGQYVYRQFRRSDPTKGDQAGTEFIRALELQPDNADALTWRSRLMDIPRPVPAGAPVTQIVWEPGGVNALGLRRDLDVRPNFEAYREAFTGFGGLVLSFLEAGAAALLGTNVDEWHRFLDEQRRLAVAGQATTLEDRQLADTEVMLATDASASVQARLDQTTLDIKAALEEMREEPLSFGDIVGTVAGVAAAVVAVIAAVPTAGASLVALVPAAVALSGAVIDNAEPIGKAVLAGDEVNTKAIREAYDKADKEAAAVVKGAKAIVDFVKVVQKLDAARTADNSKHLSLVRRGVELTHELLLARHRIVLAQQRLAVANARMSRADAAVAGIDAVKAGLAPSKEALRRMGLSAVALAESRADALLTLAFYAQRSVEIYLLTDEEDTVRLETGRLHPDQHRAYLESDIADPAIDQSPLIDEVEYVRLLRQSWEGLNDVLNLQVEFSSFATQQLDEDRRRLSFTAGDPELDDLRVSRRMAFYLDPASLPPTHVDAKVRGVRLALVGAKAPAGEITCEIRHGSAYETRRRDGSIRVDVLQPRVSNRRAKLERLAPDEGLGPDPLLTDPQSLAFWGRGIGGEWELSIPVHEVEAGVDLTDLTEVQIWITYQFIR